jgi:hypothetical protein
MVFMLVRTGKLNITPSLERPVYLAGFASNKPAVRVQDPLWARCLLLEQGDLRAAWVMCDLIGLTRDACQQVEARVRAHLPGLHVMIACTHTHFGPDTIGFWGPQIGVTGVDPVYFDALMSNLEALILATSRQPPVQCSLRAASVRVPNVAKNYRDEHIVDDEATCLQWLDAQGQPAATWVIYPCHPEAVVSDWADITSDYGHGLRETVEAQAGGMAFFAVGALGGMMSPTPTDQTHEQAYAMGRTIAQAALEALALAPIQFDPSLTLARHEVRFPLRNELYVQAAALGLIADRRDAEGFITTETSQMRLGSALLMTVPGELFPRVGLHLKQALRRDGVDVVGVVGLVNDELGYLLHPEDFIFPQNYLEPGKQYEESMSPGPDAVPALLAAWGLAL